MSGAVATQSFDFSRVGTRITELISRNLVPFSILALILAGLPTIIVALVAGMMPANPGEMSAMGIIFGIVLVLIAMLPSFVLQAALTRAAIDDLNGKPVSVAEAIQTGIQNLLPLLGLGIVMILGIYVGLLLFIVPGLILLACWIVAGPALIVERIGIFPALQRSLALTRGHRWAMFGLIVIFYISAIIVSIILALIMTGSVGLMAVAQAQATGGIIYMLLNAIVQTALSVIGTIGIAVVYFELRRIKEGVDVTGLASVFD